MNHRAYRDDDDYTRMLALLSETYAAVRGPVCCTTGELDWWRFQEEDPDGEIASVRLWETPEGDVVAYAWPGGDEVDVAVHPSHTRLLDDVLAWAESWRRTADDRAGSLMLRSSVADETAASIYRDRSYEPTDPRRHWRLRSLEAPLPEAPLPDGYTIGPILRSEFERRAALTEHPYTAHLTRAPGYRADLDLVVRAPDRSLAAFCTAWVDERNELGILEPVECLLAHRRRGLARAVMIEALRAVRASNAHSAMITNRATNVPASALYASLGFEKRGEIVIWERDLASE